MRKSVHPHLVIWCIHTHCLFAHSTLVCIPWRLVMVWERNNWGAYAKYHGWMDFTMCVRDVLWLLIWQVIDAHRNHSRLFFLYVYELNQTFLAAFVEVPLVWTICDILVENLLDVPFSQLQPIVLYNIKGSLNSARICAEFDFAPCKVTNDGNLWFDDSLTSPHQKVLE